MVDVRSRRSAASSMSLNIANGDDLYRWAMWRMHINEDMSCKISECRDFGVMSSTVSSVAKPYVKHPSCCKYGKLMRRRFGSENDAFHYRSRLKLTDGQFLVYGIPRVSLNKYVPSEVQQLYQSCRDIPLEMDFHEPDTVPYDDEAPESVVPLHRETLACRMNKNHNDHDSHNYESEQITKLFKFVTDDTPNTSPRESTNDTKDAITCHEISLTQHENDITGINDAHNTAVDKERLVTRSKVFWKKLAQRKQDIIELGKENSNYSPEKLPSSESHVISSDILLKQQKLLKATPKQKVHKDNWRKLAERKTEILKMSDYVKPKESKSTQLWNFIASKKNELLHIKRGTKSYSDVVGVKHDNLKSVTAFNNDDSVKASNFQDSFQKELEEKLRRRRLKQQMDEEQI